MATQVITTNLNLDDESKVIKSLENNVDTKTLKTKYAELYKALLKVSSYMKFDVV